MNYLKNHNIEVFSKVTHTQKHTCHIQKGIMQSLFGRNSTQLKKTLSGCL